jgi:hypothetical protein
VKHRYREAGAKLGLKSKNWSWKKDHGRIGRMPKEE